MTTGHSVEAQEFLTDRAHALSSYALTYVAGLTAGIAAPACPRVAPEMIIVMLILIVTVMKITTMIIMMMMMMITIIYVYMITCVYVTLYIYIYV